MNEWPGELEYRFVSAIRNPDGWMQCFCRGPFETEVEILLYQTGARLWTWRWAESWLGHTCVSEPRMSWLSRDHALDALRRVAVLYRVSGLADHMLTWRV